MSNNNQKPLPIRENMILAGVNSMRAQGHAACNANNICTDHVYAPFFLAMLDATRGKNAELDAEIDILMGDIAAVLS